MDLKLMLRPLLVGFLTGAICVGGLKWGLTLLMDTQADTTLDPRKRRLNLTLAGVIIGGQFILAMLLLFESGAAKQGPIALALGLIASIFLMSLSFK